MLMLILLYFLLFSISLYILALRKEKIKEEIEELKQFKFDYYRGNAKKTTFRMREYVLVRQDSASYSGDKELIKFVNEVLKKHYNIKRFIKLEKKKSFFIEWLDIQRFIVFFFVVGIPVIIVCYFLDCIKFLAKYLIRFLTFIILFKKK